MRLYLKIMNARIILLSALIILMISCKTQSNENEIRNTTNKVLVALEKGDEEEFEKLIGVELSQIGKNKELLNTDFEKCKFLYTLYASSKKVDVIISDEYNELGSRKVILPIYKGYDSLNNISAVRLELYFGPPNFVSLEKISDYKIIVEQIHQSSTLIPLLKDQ